MRMPLLLLQIVAWMACTLPQGVDAQTRADERRIERAEAQFRAALDALDAAPAGRSRYAVRRAVSAAGQILTRRGVRWTYAPDRRSLVIVPVRGGSELNDLAYQLRRDVGGLVIAFDPGALKDEDAGALYYDDEHRLIVSSGEIATGKVSDYLAHEILHARNLHALARGVDNLFFGWLSSAADAPPFHEAYPHRFSIDEIQAYAWQACANLRALTSPEGHRDFAGTIDMLESGERLARAAADASQRAAALAAALIAAGPPPAMDEARTLDDRRVTATVFRSSEGSIAFHRGVLPSRFVDPPAILHMVAQAGDYSLELIVPQAFSPAVAGLALTQFGIRSRRLGVQAQRIAERFARLQVLLATGGIHHALELALALNTLAAPGSDAAMQIGPCASERFAIPGRVDSRPSHTTRSSEAARR